MNEQTAVNKNNTTKDSDKNNTKTFDEEGDSKKTISTNKNEQKTEIKKILSLIDQAVI